MQPISGCDDGFFLLRQRLHASLVGEVVGGHTKRVRNTQRIYGGYLADFELESNRYPIGLLFC